MTVYFADTSAIAKRYLPEVGSAWVTAWAHTQSGHAVVISRLTTVELVSALARRQREMSISAVDFAQLRGSFLSHTDEHYMVINLAEDVMAEARDLLARYPLRTLDAIQLACAIKVKNMLGVPIIFVSADTRLLTCASSEGFTIDNPNNHP
jgi:uncharacterized protein